MAYRYRGLGRARGLGATQAVQNIAQAIATAEGYFKGGQINTGAAPVRNNNPCDLTSGGALAVYPDITSGWNACYNQVGLIVNDQSSVYSSDMSLNEIASHWAPAPSFSCGAMCAGNVPSNWAATVAAQLGIDPNTPIGSYASGSPSGSASAPPSSPVDASGSTLPDLSTLTSAVDLSSIDWSNPWTLGAVALLGVGLVVWAAS